MKGEEDMLRESRRLQCLAIMLSGLLILVSNLTALGQTSGTIQGTVTDPSGAAVVGAKIMVKNEATGEERTTQTDSAGAYQVAALPVGTYQVELQAQGFQSQLLKGLVLQVSQTVVQNVQLAIGGVTQEVTVTAEGGAIESGTITVGQVIDRKTVQEIPLNGRHFVDLGLLIPGTVTPPQNGFLTAPLRGQGSFAINTAGNREDTVNFMINGINLNDMVQNQITFQPSINTVQEFKVDNSTFSAEYGRNSGAIVNIATRSGTNQFHGEAFEFLRNDKFDATNFFLVPPAKKQPFKRNQFGGSVGGPIIKDKAFFFFSYEGTRQRQGLPINGQVFSDAQRAAVSDPTSKKLLSFIPQSNLTVVTSTGTQFRFVGSATAPVNIDQWTGDVSYRITANDRIHGYYAFQKDLRGEPVLQGNTVPGFGDMRQSHRQIFTLAETHTFGPNLVNEARLGFNRIHITFAPVQALNPADFGISQGLNQPLALPQITVSSIGLNFGGPSGFPQGRGDTTIVASDTASYLHHNHSFSIGGEFRDFLNNNFANTAGTFTFASPATFGQGVATAFTTTLGAVTSSLSAKSVGAFIQDNYRFRPNVTIELGLRYDVNMSPSERFNRFVAFNPATDTLTRVDQGYATNKKHFQPRLGFAWDPFRDGKTSVRGGYAILYDQPVTGVVTGLTSNPPLAVPVAAQGSISFENPLTTAGGTALAPAATNANFKEAYIQSWNLNIQREITPTLGIMVGYFGSKGTNLRLGRNLNERINGGARPFPALSASSPIDPGVALNNITEGDSGGNSSYNALWVTANKRLKNGMQFNASYTFSKSIDYNSLNANGVVVQDSNNIRNDRGRSDFDARHRFVVSWIYDLPFKANRVVQGWQLSGITQVQTGNPLNLFVNAIGANNFTGNGTLRPDVLGPIVITGDPQQWFANAKICDPRTGPCTGATFAVPVSPSGVFHFGNLGRNAITGPGFSNTDFSVSKGTKITETSRLVFRADFFDILNQANFGNPALGVQAGSANFGIISTTRFPPGDSGSSRQIQFS